MPKAKGRRPIVSVHVSSKQAQQQQPQQQQTQQDKKRPRADTHATGTVAGHWKQTQQGSGHTPKGVKTHQNPDLKHAANEHAPKAQKNGGHHGRHGHNLLVCCSIVDRQAAAAMTALLHADAGHGRGATLKSLTLAPHIEAKKATYAVTCQAMKHLPILQEVVKRSRLMQQPGMDKMSECTAYVLVYELLAGQGLHQRGPAERLVAKHKDALQEALKRVMQHAGAKSLPQLLEAHAGPEAPVHPRWVRVNTLKTDVQQALTQLKELCPAVTVDPLLPDVLRLRSGTSLHGHPLVASGAIVQQSKASAMPAHALAPQPGWHCVDCCAAPGNKTTHLAAVMKGTGRVDAYDKDPQRLKRLQANAQLAGAQDVIHAHLQDFLTVDTTSEEFAEVRGVLLDPSCSGSGTLVSRQDHLLPSWGRKQAAMQRVREQHALIIAHGGPLDAPQQQQASTDKAPLDLQQSTDHQGGEDQEEGHQGQGSGEEEQGAGSGDEDQGRVEADDMQRVQQLAKFQVAVLRHALTFPALQRLVYSTCSIHAEENELVVQAVLSEARELGFELEKVFPQWPRRGLPYFEGCDNLVRTDPYEDETDGFFIAVFQRNGSEQERRNPMEQSQADPAVPKRKKRKA